MSDVGRRGGGICGCGRAGGVVNVHLVVGVGDRRGRLNFSHL